MRNLLGFSLALIIILAGPNLWGQCFDCNLQNPTNINSIPDNSNVCITSDVTWNDISVGNNVKICIATGASLTILNNFNTTANHSLKLDISGQMRFGQKPTFRSDLFLQIHSAGKLIIGTEVNPSDIEFNGAQTKIFNNGLMITNVLGFLNNSSINEIENSSQGTLDIRANININGQTNFENFGVLNIRSSYNNNATSSYVNCGIINAQTGFNLGGGLIINSGTFNHGNGQLDMTGSSKMENYGEFTSLGTINGGSNAVIYNEGLMRITSTQPNGMRFEGPSSDTKMGYFYVINSINPNGAKVGPNLDFTSYSAGFSIKSINQNQAQIFSNAPVYINAQGNTTTADLANVRFDCEGNGNCSAVMIIHTDCNSEIPNQCTKPPVAGTAKQTNIGINTYKEVKDNWPYSEPNGFISLESSNKGFVITRVAHVSFIPTITDSIEPSKVVEGMLVYDIQDACVKLFNGTNWKCISNCQ